MKKNYTSWGRIALLSLTAMLTGPQLSAQTPVVQTFTYTGTIGTFTVPSCVTTITMDVRGAQGGFGNNGTGGLGARMVGEFAVTPGQVIRYLVGQSPGNAANAGFTFPGGGGGSYVAMGAVVSSATPMIVAGGGGGGYGVAGANAPTTTSGTGGNPGVNGNGAPSSSCGGGGGGFFTSGGNDVNYGFIGGQGFQQGGAGGGPSAAYLTSGYQPGGFGGGTAANYVGSCNLQGGNGGGYSGGSGYGTSFWQAGSAGGSFNAGTNQANTAGFNTGHGTITFTYIPSASVQASGTSTSLCSGNSSTLAANNVSTYTWQPMNTIASSVAINPTSNTSYTVFGTNNVGCVTSAVINVSVSASLPSLSVTASSNTLCLGQAVSLTASGAVTYTWTNGVVNGVVFTPTATNAYTVSGENGCGISTSVRTITIAPLPVSIVANPTTICAGFTSTLTANAAANTFSWFPTTQTGSVTVVSPSASIVYTLAVSDGTCAGTQTLSLITKITPTITAAVSNTRICQGESVVLTATGAGANATYSWAPNSSTSGTVTVTPTVNTVFTAFGTSSINCSASAQVFLIVDSAPNLAVAANKTLACAGSPVNLTASGASSYSWTGGPNTAGYVVNPTAASTTYTIMGGQQSNTCTAMKTIVINAVIPNVSTSPSVGICVGNSTILTATGASNYTWTGFPGNTTGTAQVTPATTTAYTVVASTTSLNAASQPVTCTTSAVKQVVVNPNPTISVVPTRTATICRNETNTLTASGASTYSWGASGAGTSIVITPSAALLYTVTGVDSKGCSTTIFYQAKVTSCQGIGENALSNQMINVYHNPNNGEFSISTTSEISLQLVNSLGQTIRTLTVQPEHVQNVQITGLSAGIYFLNGENAEGKVNLKVIITK